MAKANPDAPLVPAFDVLLDGTSYAMRFAAHLRSLLVEDDVALPGMLALELAGAPQDRPASFWLDDKRIALGSAVEVKLGYADGLETVFRGDIAALEADFAGDRPPAVRLRAYDARQKLQRGTRTRTFTGSTDSDIVSEIGRDAGLSIDAEPSGIVHDYAVQMEQSDLAFLLARADAIGFELVVRDGKLAFRPAAFDGGAALTLDVTADLLEFSASLSLAQQVGAVEVRGWSVRDKEALVSRSEAGAERAVLGGTASARIVQRVFGGAVEDRIGIAPAATRAEADAHARARFNAASLALLTAEGLSLGRTDLRAGTVLQIEGAGPSFSGSYYVTSVQHRYAVRGGYTTRFSARRNAA